VHGDDRERLAAGVARSLRDGAPLEAEFRVAGDAASAAAPRWLRMVGWCDVDEHGLPVLFDGISVDVSTHKHAELELQRLASAVTERNRLQSEFLFTLAHELRNPLAPIRAGLELMAAGGTTASTGELQGMMRRQVDHMVHLVDDLLDTARLAEGKVALRCDGVTLAEVVTDAVEISTPLLDGAGHRLLLDLPAAPVALYADRHRIAQVLSNLINNAAKYTPPGGRIEVAAVVEGGEAVISVSDNGVGIAPHFLASVFDMYAQAQGAELLAQGGLGVGLHLVQQLVQLHGGRVAAHSAGIGQGSRFTVWLPLPGHPAAASGTPSSVASPALPDQQSAGGDGTAQGLNVLVVDDNVDAAETLAALLEFYGHQVSVAHSGTAALSRAAELLPRVVFLDIGLPDMSGFDAALALRKIDGMAQAKIIALTGWGTDADKQRSSAAGFDLHLTKPVDFDHVRDVLTRIAAEG
jgi:signal transduction histidine kinase